MYNNIVRGNCAITTLNRIIVLQKRAIRIITNSHYLEPTNPLFHKLNTLKVSDIHITQVANVMYSYSKGVLPSLFNNYFIANRQVNRYQTRNSNNLHIPFYYYNISRTTVKYIGPKLWNTLPAMAYAVPLHIFI